MPQNSTRPDEDNRVVYQEPLHPGNVIRSRLFAPLNTSQKDFCDTHGINETTFSRVLNGTQPITADTALKLAEAFGLSEMFFMNLQNRHDLEMAKRKRNGRQRYDG